MTQSIPKQKLVQHLLSIKKEIPCNEPDASYWHGWNTCLDTILIDISLGKLDDVKPRLGAIVRDKVTPI